MRRPVLAAALACTVLTACGSTVQLRGTAVVGGDGLAAQAGGSSGGTTGSGALGTTGATGATVPGGTTGNGFTGSGGSAGSAAGTGTGAGQVPGSVQGATPPATGTKLNTIEVGIMLYPDLGAFAAMFGGAADTGDQNAITDTMEKWVNAHGGVAGHPIKVVKHNVSLTSSDTYDQLAQQACEDFTVDHHAAMVFAPGTAVSNNFAACLKKKNTQLLMSGHWVHDATDWAQVPNLWSANEVDSGQIARAMVDKVLSTPLAKSGQSIGLMTMTEPGAVRAANDVLKPKLKAAGITVVEYTVPPPASTADISNSVAVVNSAELRMASQNIKSVMFLCPGCLPFFARQANSQAYYPRYLGTSLDSPAGIKGSEYDASMKSAIMLGWQPHQDVGLRSHPNELTDNPTRKLCTTIMDPSKQSHGDVSEYATQVICDSFLQLKYAAERNPANPLTGPALQVGMGLFGTGLPCALNFGTTNLTRNRHGGVTAYRTMHWDSEIQFFVYDSQRRLSFR